MAHDFFFNKRNNSTYAKVPTTENQKGDQEEEHEYERRNAKRGAFHLKNPIAIIGIVIVSLLTMAMILFTAYKAKQHKLEQQCKGIPPWMVFESPEQKQQVEDLRKRLARASIQILLEDTEEAASKSNFTDIGEMVDIVEEAFDTIGVRLAHTVLLEWVTFAETLNRLLQEESDNLNAGELNVETSHTIGQKAHMIYHSLPTDRPTKHLYFASGAWFWLIHWIGAIAADKIIRDKFLLLDPASSIAPRHILDPKGYVQEMQRIQRLPCPDMMAFHTQHGFIWHYVAAMHRDSPIDRFPSDLAEDVCGDLLYRREVIDYVGRDMGQECRHAFGHAVFYSLATQEIKKFDIRQQLRPRIGYHLSEESLCKAKALCDEAHQTLGWRMNVQCFEGIEHSTYLFDSIATQKQARRYMHNHCANGILPALNRFYESVIHHRGAKKDPTSLSGV